ncbi:MAG: alpha-glucosidase [Lachnospiraceae bacterium]|nr:alpha-glucosidase [Lachnospiraceae bacterium]
MKRKWWHGKVAYQIYPKSFKDTNKDGIGDIRGVIEKLDYLKDLGIGIIWLSPIYKSPLADQGYDISDYYAIDPVFGTMDDFEELLKEAKKRDIAILMDLVVNHCSDEHEWFKKACEDPEGEYGRYFYIRDWHKGEPLPCNWRSYFGGSCWDLLPGHDDKIYLHVFHKKQPDLNWENPKLREEIYKMMNWWLDKGLAGYRIDAIINIKKVLPFKDYPIDRADGLSSIDNMLSEARGIEVFLNEMAERTFKPHDSFSVGEVFNVPDSELYKFIGEDGCFSSMFDFNEHLIGREKPGSYNWRKPTAEEYKKALFDAQEKIAGVGFYSNIIENHDEPRGVSHYIPEEDLSETSKKMLAGLSLMLPGLPFIYQGQEIGMENITVSSIDEIDDISARGEYEGALIDGISPEEALKSVVHYSRDNARTPFQWDDTKGAGFTDGTAWMRINPNYKDINLKEQKGRANSVFEFYKKLISLRTESEYKETLIYGSFTAYLREKENLVSYIREGDRKVLIAANFGGAPQSMTLPGPVKNIILSNLTDTETDRNMIDLAGYQIVIMEIE